MKRFKLAETVGRTILMKGSNGASVGLLFKMLLRENGIDHESVVYVQDLDGKILGDLLAGGMGDYLLVENLSAGALMKCHSSISMALEIRSEICRDWYHHNYIPDLMPRDPLWEMQSLLVCNVLLCPLSPRSNLYRGGKMQGSNLLPKVALETTWKETKLKSKYGLWVSWQFISVVKIRGLGGILGH